MTDLVSIITPCYNSSAFVLNTIESVKAQTYSNWEMIIVDDFSKDNTTDLIKKYPDSRITLVELKKNVGAAEARNIALRLAKGKYIAFLDSDDIWVKTKLEEQLNFMQEKGYAFTFSNYNIINEQGIDLSKTVTVPKSISYHKYLKNTIIGCLTVVIDKEKTGYFEMPLIKSSHDMALWLLIMKRGHKAYGIQKTLATYRLVSTSNTSKKWKAAKDVWKVYREIEKLNVFYSAYCFVSYALNAILKRI